MASFRSQPSFPLRRDEPDAATTESNYCEAITSAASFSHSPTVSPELPPDKELPPAPVESASVTSSTEENRRQFEFPFPRLSLTDFHYLLCVYVYVCVCVCVCVCVFVDVANDHSFSLLPSVNFSFYGSSFIHCW